jgi:hypothetical protein
MRPRVPDPLIGPMDVPDWSRWEQLIADRGIVIERPRGHAHPLYPDMIYPATTAISRARPQPTEKRSTSSSARFKPGSSD